MKLYGAVFIAVAVIMLLAPIASLPFGRSDEISEAETYEYTTQQETVQTVVQPDGNDTVSVFKTSENKAEILGMREYIIGVVASEVPASYEIEAIKAQALVAITYAEYRKNLGGDSSMDGAVVSDDSNRHQGYISKEEMQSKWGDAFDSYYERICEAVDEVLDEVIIYDGEPIMAAYHAMSSGKTESAEVAWGKDIAYLQTVDSEWDRDSTRFESENIYTVDEIAEIMKKERSEVYIKTKSTSRTGTVLEIDICGVTMNGMEVRELLGLRSPVFTVVREDDEYIFTVKGYGHGVGMSQNGANCMAQNGCSYKEIISHYYKDTQISSRQL